MRYLSPFTSHGTTVRIPVTLALKCLCATIHSTQTDPLSLSKANSSIDQVVWHAFSIKHSSRYLLGPMTLSARGFDSVDSNRPEFHG